ncbi:ATP-binding protein [Pseudalkalibacillus decolorationis]|uniref:ATP-binding protein n=1 Tax=Pseudalkalibacillus decolorationis TaxID=163879 RepID=UPI002147BC18|nr:AAA family ATPase [Pseudalkalibacillus decolorationis]
MKVQKLQIYGFGRFSDESFSFEQTGIHVVYGNNESGKSTILAFIEYMLFGFPKRTEKRIRYEPKTTQAYGGKITLDTEKYGLVTIERKGNSTGSVHIIREDGTEEKEAFLQTLLTEVNHLTYQNIFSFNLDGLQRIDQIRSDEIGNYLFNAAMTGAQELNKISDFLEDQQGQLFKPNGKNPVLNQKLSQLMELDRNVKSWSMKLDDYNQMKEEHNREQAHLRDLELNRRNLDDRRKELAQIQSFVPLIEQKASIQHQIAALPSATPFPENGLERFKNWVGRKVEAESEQSHLKELCKRKQLALQGIKRFEELLIHTDAITKVEKAFEQYKVRESDYQTLRQRLLHLEEEIEAERIGIGENWDNDRILAADTGIVIKQQIKQVLKEHDQLLFEQKTLDADLHRAKTSIDENERHLEAIQKQLLSQEEKQAYEKRLEQITEESPTQLKLQLETLKRMKDSSQNVFMNPLLIKIMVIVGIILMGIWFYQGDIVEGSIIGVSLIGSGIVLLRKNKNGELEHLHKQITNLESEINNLEKATPVEKTGNFEDIRKILKEQQHLSFREQQLNEQVGELERNYQEVASKYDYWELQFHKKKEELNRWREHFRIPESISNDMILDVLERVEQLKKRINEMKRINEDSVQLQKGLTRFEAEVYRLRDVAEIAEDNIETIVSRLILLLETEWKRKKQTEQLINDIHMYEEQDAALVKKIHNYDQECKSLFNKAEVKGEEAFWVKGRAYESYQSLKGKLLMVDSQLQMAASREKVNQLTERIHELAQLEQEIQDVHKDLQKSDENIEITRNECSRLHARLTHLEEDGSYSDLIHQLQISKSEFHDQAKEWAIYRTAEYLLNQAKQNYQSRKQPSVIKRAEVYFNKLTNGEYVKVIAPKSEESFLIERNDSILFRPEELSRATAEQLYLALRFALAEEYDNNQSFPFIMDDILVNFDESRRESAIQLINSITSKRQVIYFTCDQRTADTLSVDPIVLTTRSSNEVLNTH